MLNTYIRCPFIGIIIVFCLIPSLKTESSPKCGFPHWTICRLACCQIKLHTALVNLISNLMAEPQPDKMHVASDGNCSETIVSLGDTQSCRYLCFFLVARVIPDCLGRSPTSYWSPNSTTKSHHLIGLWTRLLRGCVQEDSQREDGYTCAPINSPESKLIN